MVVLIMLIPNMFGQLINVNPDPNGDPWWVGGCELPSPDEMALVPEFVTSPEALAVVLPTKVYNNDLVYFPPIFYQQGASCVQAAEVGYNFTYEINRFRGVPTGNWNNIKTNCYHHLFTYNFLNDADGFTTTDIYSGFNIIKENGCPSYDIYDDPAIGPIATEKFKYWMIGYNNYFSGMHNRISSYHTFTVNNLLFNHGGNQ